MHRVLKTALVACAALNAWIALALLIFDQNVGALPFVNVKVLAACALLLIAPALTFIPLARALRAPLYEVEGIAGWATFGFVFTFVTPDESLSRTEFLMFLLPLVVVIATVATLVAYAFGVRVYRGTPLQRDFLRARRQGYIVGLVAVALFLLHGIQVLNLMTGALLVVIAMLCEMVMLSRARPASASRSTARAQPQHGSPDQAARTP